MRTATFNACAATLALAAVSMLAARPARACGGCFSPPQQRTVVTDHRMAFAVSQQQTVLWDQIEYSGEPDDFAWVLPVRQGARVELSHDEWFAALNALTDPVVTAPPNNCGGGGVGCGSALGNATASPNGDTGGGVQVISQGVVGPYETVTLRSTDPNALYVWLNDHQYDVPDTDRPVIDAYVGEQFDFIALRLRPGQGVQAMQPVRVVSPGAGLSMPLRMVAAGVGAQVGITLYVIGEGRYEAENFPNALFDDSKLLWLHAQSRSNYEELSQQIMQVGAGRTWLTEFSGAVSLTGSPDYFSAGSYSCPSASNGGTFSFYGAQSLAGLYYGQCQCVAGGARLPDAGCIPGPDAGCGGPCDAFDDPAVALVGMNPGTTWVTRLRAILPSNALSEGDLVLQASASQTPVSQFHTAVAYDDPSYSPCGQTTANGGSGTGSGGCSTAEPRTLTATRHALILGSLGLVGVALVRRRRRHRAG